MTASDIEPGKRFVPQQKSVRFRNESCALAAQQPKTAFEHARRIPDGWYRCQAMAYIAQHAPADLSAVAFREALHAASSGFDTYQQAAALAWPLESALKCGKESEANAALSAALARVPGVTPMASRAHALDQLWRVVAREGNGRQRNEVIHCAISHVAPDLSWRARRLFRDITDWLSAREPRKARALVEAMPMGKAREYLRRRCGMSPSQSAWAAGPHPGKHLPAG